MSMTTFADRLNELISYYRLNKNSFSVKLGFTANTSITRLANHPDRNPSFDILASILRAFPEVSARWLVLGDGKMLERDEIASRAQWISYYKWDDTSPLSCDVEVPPADIMRVTGYHDCDMATDVYGEAMEPKIKAGDIILCKKADDTPIVYGEPYLIMTKEPVIRYIKGSPADGIIRVGAENPRVDDYEINLSDVVCLYRIKGIIRRESV